MLFEQESSSSFVSLNEIKRSKSFCSLTASLSSVSLLKSKLQTFVLFCVLTFLVWFSFKVAWTAESFAPEEGLLYYQRRHSFSGFERSSSLQSLTGLRRDVRLCRSLSSLSRVSGGDVLRYWPHLLYHLTHEYQHNHYLESSPSPSLTIITISLS
jgi:hypothetical protein